MTLDDESSIYVGGLPYDATEDSLRRVFDIYGAVVAIKIINDRSVGGKCYGFITFTNPRSALHAIKDMDGRTIDGRVVRVNDVKTRGGRPNFGREDFRRNSERDTDSNRGRDREKDHDHHRERYRDSYREREQSRDRGQEWEGGYDRMRDHDRTRDRLVDRGRACDQYTDLENVAREPERIHDYDWERDRDSDKEIQRNSNRHKSGEREKDQMSKLPDRSYSDDRGKRDCSSELNDDDHGEVAKQIEISNLKLQELQKELSEMEVLAEEKKQLVVKLQDTSQKLEDSLIAARRQTSYRKMHLSKLHKCYLQLRDCNERLKTYEHELQSLVDTTMMELEYGDSMAIRDAS